MDFVHLHNHSEYSILDSTNTISGLLDKAEENDMQALALTDHGNVGGALKFYREARSRGIKPILGCELYVAPGSRFEKGGSAKHRDSPNYYHLVVLAEDNEGYQNLIKLSSLGYTEGFYYKPRVDRELLRDHSGGLIALSACKSGAVPSAILKEGPERAKEEAEELADIFGRESFFIELQDHGVEGQEELNEKLRTVAEELDLGLVATNDIHYLEKEDRLAHEVLLNIQANKKLTDEDRRTYEGDEYYFKSTEEMRERFQEVPQALENTVEIARRCEVELSFEETYLPPFEVPAKYDGPSDYLRHLVREGAKERWGEITEEIEERIEHELGVIEEMGYPTYFLIVRDFIRFAQEEDIPVGPGRGSAASSVVGYCLGITEVDPLKRGLLFERFLNPGRVSMPDIDIDFCKEGRDEVIDYVVEKYGEEQVAQIATFDTMAARSAVRDVARVLDIDYDKADEIAKAIPQGTPLDQALENVGELGKLYEEGEDKFQDLFDISLKLEGLMRNASTHAAGVVIAPGELCKYTPLQRLSDGEVVTQFDMGDLEEIGLLKMDFLGLRNLTIIERTFDMVESEGEGSLCREDIPLTDEETFQLLRAGKTAGVFQLESSGMQNLLRRLEPEEFEDIVAVNALYRPGPLESGMTEDYIERKHGREEVSYPHPELEGVLDETYGLPIYQEQIMKMAQVLAGFSLPEADTLRVAMGKKKQKVMDKLKEKFIQGCVENGIQRTRAEELFADIDKFSRYGFNKSHSTAYAYITYWTAWLKAHYPASYMASLLTSVGGNEDKVAKYVKDCQSMDIEVKPPDINESDLEFKPTEEGNIIFGLGAIKYVGEGPAGHLIAAREEEGYSSFFDLCRKVDPSGLNREALESLIKVGALDSFGTRKYLLSRLEEGLELNRTLSGGRRGGQKSFFDQGQGSALTEDNTPREEMERFSKVERLQFEKDLLGLYVTGDPLEDHQLEMDSFCSCKLGGVTQRANGKKLWLGGRISELNQISTKKGDPMAFITLSDGEEEEELVAFPSLFEKAGELIAEDEVLLVKAKLGERRGKKQLVAEDLIRIEEAWDKVKAELTVEMGAELVEESALDQLENLLEEGDTPLFFKITDEQSGKFCVIRAGGNNKAAVSPKLMDDLNGLDFVRGTHLDPQVS